MPLKKQKVNNLEPVGKESWRDLSIRKNCALCGKEYHPRKNSYQSISRYCSAICARSARKKKPLI
jgi:hypothetical protein